jgi:hypothetical protein
MKRKNYGQLLIPLEGLDDDDFRAARDTAIDRVKAKAGHAFFQQASAIVLEHLTQHGPTSSEALTDECKRRGVIPHDDRAFGPVYLSLLQRQMIEPCGTAIRTKGHGTAGGRIWKLISQ